MGVIWTNHLKERIKERQIDPRLVDLTIKFPDKIKNSHTENSKKFLKDFDQFQIIATVKYQGNDWIITSVWKKPGVYLRKKSFLERLVYGLVVRFEEFLCHRFNR